MLNQKIQIPALLDQHKSAWHSLQKKYQLSAQQLELFARYVALLLQENGKYNITAIVEVDDIIRDHFADSLILLKNYDTATLQSLIDVGSGGGFPGIPLAIMLPHVAVQLIEVNLKKVHFLNLVIQELQLPNVTVHTDDWRTFLRSCTVAVDLVIARASLPVEELVRMFKPSCVLQSATLIYWASKKWIPTLQENRYLEKCVEYAVGQKSRKLCFLKNK